MSNLPKFKYHPNIYEDDVVFHSDGTCQCCGKEVDVFTNSMYTQHEIQCICMNCIADGSAAKKIDEMEHAGFLLQMRVSATFFMEAVSLNMKN